ncbi:hypothetical protein QR680_003811 [Steinernema hermaphroditum]|uniref:J domain-containing protein n=1 Tax=Steinernema hermaphroditum TaxID=289476 RepID=A0AA39LS68_9BILA|nr:hypothetical protein QR680_003811 [Steinernema hermaphroditum]
MRSSLPYGAFALERSHMMPATMSKFLRFFNRRFLGHRMLHNPESFTEKCQDLGIKDSATTNEIKHAYFTLSKKIHPDLYGPVGKIQFKTVYDAYKVLMYWNTPVSFGNFPEASSNCESYLHNDVNIEVAFVEICIEYDALSTEYREIEKAFFSFFKSKEHTQSHDDQIQALTQLHDYQDKFADLHKAFDEVHDVVESSRKNLTVNNKCTLEAVITAAQARRKFWNAQKAYMGSQRGLLLCMDQEAFTVWVLGSQSCDPVVRPLRDLHGVGADVEASPLLQWALLKYAYNCGTLCVTPNATTEEIKEAYFMFSKKLHPALYGRYGIMYDYTAEEAQMEYHEVYNAYKELMHCKSPDSLGNFLTGSSSSHLVTELHIHTDIEEAFVETCVEYDALSTDFRELERAFLNLNKNNKDIQSSDTYLIRDHRNAFNNLHNAFDKFHDIIESKRRRNLLTDYECTQEDVAIAATASRNFWHAQIAFMGSRTALSDRLNEAGEEKRKDL